jgi:hypothetical protein
LTSIKQHRLCVRRPTRGPRHTFQNTSAIPEGNGSLDLLVIVQKTYGRGPQKTSIPNMDLHRGRLRGGEGASAGRLNARCTLAVTSRRMASVQKAQVAKHILHPTSLQQSKLLGQILDRSTHQCEHLFFILYAARIDMLIDRNSVLAAFATTVFPPLQQIAGVPVV